MAGTARTEEMLDRLVDDGVIDHGDDGRLVLTDGFRDRRHACRTELEAMDEDEYESTLDEFLSAVDRAVDVVDRDTVADAVAVGRTCESLDRADCLVVALSLDRFDEPPRTDGVPDGFLPIRGREVGTFLQQNHAAIVYFWREDCAPCDLVREKLEALLDEGTIPAETGLVAVYGPNSPTLLREEFEVGIAPTVLFCSDGSPDSRLIGDSSERILRREVEFLCEKLPDGEE